MSLSSALLVQLAPVLAAAALAVRLESPGPILYRARRAGRGGRPFEMLKFRSMRVTEDKSAITAFGDRRITRGGAIMRQLKIDELPQLWNILKGEMTFVGPRPEDVSIVERHYSPEQRRALEVRPGLTCIAQVKYFPDMSSRVPAGADPTSYYLSHQLPEKLALDIEYVDGASLRMDIRLGWQTLVHIVSAARRRLR